MRKNGQKTEEGVTGWDQPGRGTWLGQTEYREKKKGKMLPDSL